MGILNNNPKSHSLGRIFVLMIIINLYYLKFRMHIILKYVILPNIG